MLTEELVRDLLQHSADRATIPPAATTVAAVTSARKPPGRTFWAGLGATVATLGVAVAVLLAVVTPGPTAAPVPSSSTPSATPFPGLDHLLLPHETAKVVRTGDPHHGMSLAVTATGPLRPTWQLWLSCSGNGSVSMSVGYPNTRDPHSATVCSTKGKPAGTVTSLSRIFAPNAIRLTVTATGAADTRWQLVAFATKQTSPMTCKPGSATIVTDPDADYRLAHSRFQYPPAGATFRKAGFVLRRLSGADVEFLLPNTYDGTYTDLALYSRKGKGYQLTKVCTTVIG